jgi:pimeloyl-ACP methyl ester carboxylesterase
VSLAKPPCGVEIWYRTTGSGPAILHIHGSAFGHANFHRLTPAMAESFTVVDLDLPGYGESRGAPPGPGFPGLAEVVYQLVRELGYDRLHLHGTSFGAMIGLTLAARRPEVIDRLVLSCFLARYDGAARMMRSTWKRAARESGMDAVADLTYVAGFARGSYEQPWAQAPTLLLAGAQDNMTPFNPAASGVGCAQIAAMMPAARVEVLPECGHYLVIEQPERAARLIREYVLG